ncbi:hypothetical protein [Nocardiopsis sp. FR26]|uniref:hypothetical protein n=1 Tax=Nocardiopsis sp. FR26 TaxID=2605987 RepID=UPI00135BC6DE|nr:hypothetical protein [Nocardiopsis sp. FR26]
MFWRKSKSKSKRKNAPVSADTHRDPWDSDLGRELLDRMYTSNRELAAEVDRGRERQRNASAVDSPKEKRNAPENRGPGAPVSGSLHAHEITPDDAALIRMLVGAHFGDDATVILPSGKATTGAEMRRWIEAQE